MNKWIQNDLILRLISVAIAITLWISISNVSFPFYNEKFKTEVHHVNIEARFDQNQFDLVHFPTKADLLLEGESYIKYLSYRLYVDLRKLGAGYHRKIPVKVEGLPPGVKYEIRPSTVDVQLEKKVKKEMPVQVNIIGNMAQGYQMGEPEIHPRKVTVYGIKSRIDHLSSVRAFVYLDNARESIQRSVKIEAYGPQGPLKAVNVSPGFVNIKIPVLYPHKEVPLKFEIEKRPLPDYMIESISQNKDKVTVYGLPEYIKNLQVYKVKLDLSHVKETCTMRLMLPVHEKVSKVTPAQVEVYIRMVPVKTKMINDIPLRLEGLQGGLHAEFLHPTGGKLNITIMGRQLNHINVGNIKAFIDVSRLLPGTYTVPISFQVPSYVQVVDMEKLKAKIEIKP